MEEEFIKALAQYQEGDDLSRFRFTYQTRWLNACATLPAAHALISLFGVHARDPETNNHIFQDVVESEWDQAIDLFLTIDPSLVNVGVWVGGIVPLIMHAMRQEIDIDIVRKLLTKDLNVALLDYKQKCVFHDLAEDATLSTMYADLIPTLISMAPAYVWEVWNESGKTLHDLCDSYPEPRQPKPPTNSLTPEHISYRFKGILPPRTWMDMSLSLIGKQLKYPPDHPYGIKLFFSADYFHEYLSALLAQDKQDFFINGILVGHYGGHSLNIVVLREKSGPIQCLLIDSLAQNYFDEEGLKKTLSPFNISYKLIVINQAFQKTDSGCRIIAAYLAGRFLKPSRVEQLKNLIRESIAQQKEELTLADLPANLGPLLICQSLRTIQQIRKDRGQNVIDNEYPGYLQRYQKGLNWQYSPGYIDSDQFNKCQNHTLYRKNENQRQHAIRALSTDYKARFAEIIGASEVDHLRCNEMVNKMITSNMIWNQLYRARSYRSSIFHAVPTQSAEHKKLKLSNGGEDKFKC